MTDLFGNPIDEPPATALTVTKPVNIGYSLPHPLQPPAIIRPYYIIKESPTVTWVMHHDL